MLECIIYSLWCGLRKGKRMWGRKGRPELVLAWGCSSLCPLESLLRQLSTALLQKQEVW